MSAAASSAHGVPPPVRPWDPGFLSEVFQAAAGVATARRDPGEALELTLNVLHDRLEGSFVSVLVPEHGRLWLVASRGYTMVPDGLPVEIGVVGRAARTGRIQYVPDLTADPDFLEVAPDIVSELAVPLSLGNELVGVVNLETSAPLPREAPRLVRTLADALPPVVEAIRGARVVDLAALSRLSVYISSLRDPQEIASVAAAVLPRVLPVETSQVFLHDEHGELQPCSASIVDNGSPQLPRVELIEELRRRGTKGAIVERVEIEGCGIRDLELSSLRSLVLIPLRVHGTELGVLVGASRWSNELDRARCEVAALLAAQVGASLDAALALGRERRSALTDPLTGLLNRRGFELELEQALASAHDTRESLSLWVLDFDDFKEVNDRAGHEFGDALLREVGVVLDRVVPSPARAGRIGGDEFVVMLPGADAEAAEQAADELRDQLLGGLDDAGFPLRASIGVATYPFDGGVGSQLLRAADQALYEAKAKGKNCVVGFRALVRDASPALPAASDVRDRRGVFIDSSSLVDAGDAALALWREHSVSKVLDRLCKALTFTVGATGCNISRIQGNRLVDVAAHALRDTGLAADTSYLIEEFPVTRRVLETLETDSISFLDDDLDRAEAFVLRDLEMSCALLVPLVVRGEAWGLVELYDMRLRRYSAVQQSVAEFLVGVAGHRLEAVEEDSDAMRPRPLFRVP